MRALGVWLAAGSVALTACNSAERERPRPMAVTEELENPETCASCHPKHYEEWASSMHAYAADDPLFLAMNRRGQREASIGTFCVNCHAPMAVRAGATTDGLNLEELPARLKGVTCYFCHNVSAVHGEHDNPLELAGDRVMRGAIKDPLRTSFHDSRYSELVDRDRLESARLCGSCHDIVNGHGVHLERTFREWQDSVFSAPQVGTSCGQCHMDRDPELGPAVKAPEAPLRELHSHRFPAVDLALTPFPGAGVLARETQSFLDTSLQTALCVRGTGRAAQLQVVLDNVAAGHAFPSGAAQDRRVWLEVVATAEGETLYESGVVAPGEGLGSANLDELFWIGDCMLGERGRQVRMFWEARDVESNLLPGQQTFDAADPRFYQTHRWVDFPRKSATIPRFPDRVTLNVKLLPFELEVFDSLVESGDLVDAPGATVAEMRAQLAPRSVGKELVWTPDTATETFVDRGVPVSCVSTTNLRASADKVPAVHHERCGP